MAVKAGDSKMHGKCWIVETRDADVTVVTSIEMLMRDVTHTHGLIVRAAGWKNKPPLLLFAALLVFCI